LGEWVPPGEVPVSTYTLRLGVMEWQLIL